VQRTDTSIKYASTPYANPPLLIMHSDGGWSLSKSLCETSTPLSAVGATCPPKRCGVCVCTCSCVCVCMTALSAAGATCPLKRCGVCLRVYMHVCPFRMWYYCVCDVCVMCHKIKGRGLACCLKRTYTHIGAPSEFLT
jgi:hypothetical protein